MITLLVVLVVIGVALPFLPIDGQIRSIVIAIIALCAFFWVLSAFGVVHLPAGLR